MTRSRSLTTALCLGIVCIIAPAGTLASTAQPEIAYEEPSPESLFERHVEAIGGDAAVRTHRSRLIKGNVDFPAQDTKMVLVLYQEAPNRLYMAIDNGLGGLTETVYDGELAWIKAGDSPAQRVPDAQLAPIIETAAFYGEADWKRRYSSTESLGRVEFDGGAAWSVRVVSEAGRTAEVLFDPDTGLIRGTRSEVAPGVVQSVLFKDYKEAGGVLAPHTLVQITGSNEAVLSYRSIEVNVDPDRDYFARPEGVEAPGN